MASFLTKLVPGTAPGTYVEAEGDIVDLLNPTVPAATPAGGLAKAISLTLAIKVVLGLLIPDDAK